MCYKAILLSVYLLVVLLLSVFTVRGSACDDLVGGRVCNLQVSIKHEEQTGFVSPCTCVAFKTCDIAQDAVIQFIYCDLCL